MNIKCISMQFLIQIYRVVHDIFHCLTTIGRTDARKALSFKIGCYACQWQDNFDMHKYANFDQNITRGSRIMNILLDGKRLTQ